ncbi:hypothetical protein ACFVYE_01035 [Streptomyces sp. NPDC058239]|uniref:hypothetical protein n=1 Tax=unclassified Streptomyces TaxID=2593676 RepID=UPI00365BD180
MVLGQAHHAVGERTQARFSVCGRVGEAADVGQPLPCDIVRRNQIGGRVNEVLIFRDGPAISDFGAYGETLAD